MRTVRRDSQHLKAKSGVIVPTRGQQKDIGPTVTPKGQAIRHWLEGKEPQEVARASNHSLQAVERYIQHFARVLFLAGQGFEPLQIAFTVGISNAGTRTYLDLCHAFKTSEGFKHRLAEVKAIGQAHPQGGDDKKGGTFAARRLEQWREKMESAMTDTRTHNQATFTPQFYKRFDGALEACFAQECPQLGGARTRQVLVQSVRQRVETFFPATTNLRAGQTLWNAVHKDEKSSYGKTITQSRLTPVNRDLLPPEEIQARAEGAKLRDLKREAVVRLFQQAYQ